MYDMDRCDTMLDGLQLVPSTLPTFKKQFPFISNLPDLEITPIPTAPTVLYTGCLNDGAQASNLRGKKIKISKEEGNMTRLLHKLPVLREHFNLYKKIGEGTYSTVYLASFKNSKSTRQFAVKHLTENFTLSRIQKELRFMQMIGGEDNVVNVLNCFKSDTKDCVVFVMPYLQHERFSEYMLSMDANELRFYMKNLFIALRRVHTFNVIHRDVKPGNFLYNRNTKEFLLVDFGLAQEVNETPSEKHAAVNDDGENTPINYSKRKRSSTDEGMPPSKTALLTPLKSRENIISPAQQSSPLNTPSYSVENKPPRAGTPLLFQPSSSSLSNSSRKQLFTFDSSVTTNSRSLTSSRREPSLGTSLLKSQTESKLATTPKDKSSTQTEQQRSFTPLVASKVPIGSFVQVRNSRVVTQEQSLCACVGVGAICTPCAGKRALAAPRAGTPGFRPPEVLLKYLHQTTAVDMWAAGVVLLCVLSGCYPFFKSPSDLAALVEIISIFGSDAVGEIASKFGRRLSCSGARAPLDLKKMCRRLRSRKLKQNLAPSKGKCENCHQNIRDDGCVCRTEPLSASNKATDGDIFPDSAYHLLSRLLDLNPVTRITAAEALQHPFIA